MDQPDIIPIYPIYPIAIFLVVIVNKSNKYGLFQLIYFTYLIVGCAHEGDMGYWCEISGVTGAIHRPLCPPPTPTNQIHYPVTTKNTFDEISNGVQHSKHCIEEKGFHVFIAQKMTFLYRGRMKEWGLFLVIISHLIPEWPPTHFTSVASVGRLMD